MDATTLNATTVSVVGSYRGAYTGVFSMSNASTMVFNPDVDFLPGELITTTVTTGAKNTSDLAIARPFSFSFTAAATGYGLFTSESAISVTPGNYVRNIVTGDFNGNGHIDFATISTGANTLSVVFNNGDGSFAPPVNMATLSPTMGIVSADFNGDGLPDLAVSNNFDYSLSIFMNQGNGNFADRVDYSTPSFLYASEMVVADMDGDGRLDIVQLDATGFFLFTFPGVGDGTFEAATLYSITQLTQGGSLAVGDYNRDWRPDIVVTDFANNNIRLYENDGAGSFLTGGSFPVGTGPASLALVSLEGNGFVDAAVANTGANTLTIRREDLGFAFFESGNFSTGNYPISVHGGDLDGDGDLDLLVANNAGSSVSFVRNRLTDSFPPSFFQNNEYALASNPNQAVLADMNGDGRLDILTANNNGTVSILYNYAGPSIVTTSPQAIGSYDDLEIEFSVDNMNAATMTTANVQVKDAGNATIASSFSYSGNTLTISPNDPLQQGTTLTVTITAGVTTTSGHAVANPGTITFNVAEAVLDIVSVSPAAYAFQHSASSGVSITFDASVNLSTLNTGVRVSGSIRGNYAGNWSGTTTATFTPSVNFLLGEEITVTITPSVTSVIGAPVEQTVAYTFMVDQNPLGSFLSSVEFVSAIGIEDMVVTDMTNNGIPDVVLYGYDYTLGAEGSYYIKVTTSDGSGNSVATTTTSVDLYRPKSFLVADFNNDGNKDVVILDSHVGGGEDDDEGEGGFSKAFAGGPQTTSGPNTTSVILLTGNGNGTFNAPSTITLPADFEIRTFTSGDLRGNGTVDLLFPREGGNDVIVALGNGNGTFAVQTPISTPGGPVTAKLADMNLDGRLDLITANAGSSNVAIRYGNGDGTFGAASTYTVGFGPYDVLVADFDNDGNPDLAVLDGDSQTEILLSNGVGGFTSGQTFATGWMAQVIDINGDAYPDLLSNTSGTSVYTNNGDGTFGTNPRIFSAGFPRKFSVIDMTGNGSADIVGTDGSSVFILEGAERVFITSTTPSSNALDIAAASTIAATFSTDMDAATITAANVIVQSALSGVVQGALNYNAGTRTVTFTPTANLLPGDKVSVTITKGVESSGNVPLETAYHFSFTVAASGNGSFVFDDVLSTSNSTNSSFLAADVDGDGDQDLIGLTNGAVKVYKNTAGVFSEFSSLVLAYWPEKGILGDFNNDGHVDIAYRRPYSASLIYFLENDGVGNFSASATAYMESSTRDAITADFDGDGNLDIAWIYGAQIMYLYWGNGDFTFPGQNTFTTGPGGGGSPVLEKLSSGDIDNNGTIDIVGYEDQNGTIVVMRNNGGRSFDFTTTYATPAKASDIELVDVTGDGYLDIVITSSVDKSFSVLTNNGNGTFAAAVTYSTSPFELNRVTPFDFTGNGHMDLAFHAYEDINGTDVLITAYNDGNGGFGNQTSFEFPSGEPNYYYGFDRNYALLDVNNDGSLDLAGNLTEYPTRYIGFALNEALPGAGLAPTTAASNVTVGSTKSTSATISWTNGDGARRLVLVKAASPVDANPVDDGGFNPNPTFGSGSEVGTGNFVVYGGSGNSATISGLTAETTYHVSVFEINGVPGQEKVLTTTPATGSFTTAGPPTLWNVNDQSVTFTKTNYAEWSHEANQDRIVPGVWFARKNNQGLFNAAQESGWDSDVSPKGTLWAQGTTANPDALTFDTFYNTLGGDEYVGSNIEDLDMVVFLVDQNIYLDINFSSWTSSNNGGGFSYTRGDGAKPEITSDNEVGYALQYNGSSFSEMNWLYMPAEHTIEMWVKPEVTGTDQVFLVYGNDRILLGINASNHFYASHFNSGSPVSITGTGISVEVDTWYHVALSAKNGGQLVLYVNSTSVGSAPIANTYLSSNTWYPGTNYNEDKMFTGQIDEFRIWGKVRTESEIRSTMYSEVSGAAVDLMGYWQFNEGSGITASDVLGFNALSLGGATWVTSTTPFGTPAEVASGVQSGTANVGGATLTFNTPFENPVDVFFNEITTAPNVFPTGFTTSLGGKYFVIDLVGDPGTFSLDLTLTFGAGVITEVNEASPSMLKLYRRSSGSTGEWAEIASASSAIAATGVVTWPGITSFSEFMAVEQEIVAGVGIENTSIVIYDEATYTFASDFFAFTGAFDNATLTVTADVTTVGTLFVDANENGTYESGTDLLLEAEAGVSYTASSANALIYIPNGLGSESVTLTFSDGTDSDQVTLSFITVVTTPTLNGVSGENGWYLLANPLNTPLSTLFSNIWTQGAENSNAPSFDPTLYTFNQTTSAYQAITGDLEATTLPAGTGILAYVFAFDNPTDGIPEGGGWPKSLQNEGNPFGQTAAVTLLNVDGDSDGMTSGSEGFALLGNPFGWNLSASAVITKLKAADPLANSYVYRWNPVLKRYQLLTSGAIQPYESVFVRVISSGEEVTLNFNYADAMNVIPASKEVADEPAMIPFALEVPALGLTSEMALRFDENGAAGIDPFDGYYLGSYARNFANLYMGNGNQALVINNLPVGLDTEETYPVYLHTTVSGEFTLTWDATLLPEGWEITLEANSGEVIDLRTENSFTFNSAQLAKAADAGESLIASRHEVPSQLQGQTPQFILRVRPAAVTSLDGADLGIPTQVELAQNYPNPFNPTTMIRFGVPEQAAVRLEVYDMLGRRVSVLVNNEVRAPGRYQVPFDGARLASGVYIYRLVVGEKVITRRMVLIK
jgi:hypothetical protein